MHDLLKDGEVEASACHGCYGQDLPGRSTQLLRPLVHGILHAAWNRRAACMCAKKQRALPDALSVRDLAGGDQRFQHFLNEEGVPLSQLVDAFYQASMHYLVPAKDALEHCIDIGAVEPLQGKVLRQMVP